MADESGRSANGDKTARPNTTLNDRRVLKGVPQIGVWAWSFVGLAVATIIVVAALAAVSEIVLPLTFAVVLGVIFQPVVEILVRHRFKPTIAAGLVVVGLLALMTGVVVATVRGVTEQADEIGSSVDAALHKAVDALGVDQASLDAARAAIEKATPTISGGVLTNLVSGIDTLIGLASGLILGALIM
jgi:putative heme transporter